MPEAPVAGDNRASMDDADAPRAPAARDPEAPSSPPVPVSDRARAGGAATARLAAVMERLRAPDGCPWDREQTWESLRRYVLEEAHELVEAIDRKDPEAVREECGDLLLEVVFVAQIAADEGRFGLSEVAEDIAAKLIRRHPHVFGASGPASGADEALQSWEAVKAREKAAKGAKPPSLPPLPALLAAAKLLERGELAPPPALTAAAQDFAPAPAKERAAGDLLLAAAAAVANAGLDPEAALRAALRRAHRSRSPSGR